VALYPCCQNRLVALSRISSWSKDFVRGMASFFVAQS
jgi:hypothetical protein